MYKELITAKTTKTADKTEKSASGEVMLYTEVELDRLESAGLLAEHRDKLNSILIIRAQDELRKTLVDVSAEVSLKREVAALLKAHPDKLAEFMRLAKEQADSDIVITR